MTFDVTRFGKVAVLMGGISAEREVSLKSGGAILAALQQAGVDAHGIDAGPHNIAVLKSDDFDRVFIALHGRWGEDGVVQGALQAIGLPYTGSQVLGSALAMDKVRSKQIWQSLGLPTAAFRVLTSEADLDGLVESLGLPLFLKPAREGSSVGIGKVETQHGLLAAYQAAAECGDDVIAETFIPGAELTVSILHDEALPIIQMRTANQFYDYEAKYLSDDTIYECPAALSSTLSKTVQDLAVSAFKALACHGWGRVDVMLDAQQQPLLLEANTVPGMTDHSLVPLAAAAAGIDFTQLVLEILAQTLESEGSNG
ncbi:D-alanine--D-alanine ligase [Arenicella chitinivorans]|uniref:D-alanine--D-alanine ligase n=1 Tax=Arenicella chitinivorans TaxID=1329800 RepID=A0A918RQ56_9GAMM|nr:D-alanine--D-alanine ligase [Arenicella chitinivorans]GHA05889.1 D-alanine--D-alanine ligase [Arenicella chitinivorans]